MASPDEALSMASPDTALRLEEVNTNQGFPYWVHSPLREIKWVLPALNAGNAA